MTPNHQNLDPKIRASAVWKSGTPIDILQTLSQDPSVIVRQNVLRAALQKENEELLEIFLLDPDPVIRAELALWPDCPMPFLRRLKQDPNPGIRGIIDSRLEPMQPEAEVPNHALETPAHVHTPAPIAPVPAPVPVPAHAVEPDEMPEQDEPTGAIHGTDKLPPIQEPHKQSPVPTRTPTAPPQRATPVPVRTPIVAPNPAPTYNPGPIRPTPIPVKSPMAAPQPIQPSPQPMPMPAPAPAPSPFAAVSPSQPTVQEDYVEVTAPKTPSPLPGKGEIRIHLTASDKSQSELTFAKDLIVIGRVLGNDIVLAQGNVSKNHCRIFVFNDQLYIEDLKSTNGTQLNKNNITPREPHPLLATDELGVGSATLKVSLSL